MVCCLDEIITRKRINEPEGKIVALQFMMQILVIVAFHLRIAVLHQAACTHTLGGECHVTVQCRLVKCHKGSLPVLQPHLILIGQPQGIHLFRLYGRVFRSATLGCHFVGVEFRTH